MNGYLFVLPDGRIAGGIARAANETIASGLFGEVASNVVTLRPDVATAMGVPEREGYHPTALTDWILGPTNFLGELLPIPEAQ
jgi:hypothetical protein